MDIIAIYTGYWISWISKTLGFGAGATWPGEVALRIDPKILSKLLYKITKGIIIVAGTNGKTTTSLMIKKILTDQGFSVLHNASGANLINGVVSAFFADNRASFDYAVFEVDENALPNVLEQLSMSRGQKVYVVLLNLFRDQLDRYGEVDTIAEKWANTLQQLGKNTRVLLNADDPNLTYIGKKVSASVSFFGLNEPSYYLTSMQHATDSTYCPSCGEKLEFKGFYFSHLGDWKCEKCGLVKPNLTLTAKDVQSPLEGVYNIYNTLAATLTTKRLGLTSGSIQQSLKTFTPAFGRMEDIIYQEKQMKILLSKNPTGFNESLRTVLASKRKGPLLLLLNDRIPDGTDVSWIWDVDFEILEGYKNQIVVSGDRALDLELRLKYGFKKYDLGFMNKIRLEENINEAVKKFVSKIKNNETGWVLATYSAMLEVRKILTGRKIL